LGIAAVIGLAYRADLAPDLDRHDLAQSLYRLLADHYGVVVDHGEQAVWAESADGGTARALGAPVGLPLLVFQRTSTSITPAAGTAACRTPVEFVTSWYRGDRYQVRMSLGRTPTGPTPPT